jgi:copper(I)-binding protein
MNIRITLSRAVPTFCQALCIMVLPVLASATRGETLVLEGAWVRAMPPGRPMTAAYLTVANPSDATVTVTSVRASRGTASLHESRTVDGQMQMRELSELTVPAQGRAVLEPGGLHIMLMDLDSTPAEGEALTLCVKSLDGEVCTEAPVLRSPPTAK